MSRNPVSSYWPDSLYLETSKHIMNTDYKKAIDILTGPETIDYRKVCVELAKTDPAAFVRLVRGNTKAIVEWHNTLLRHIKENRPIDAIKLVREKTGFGLKESKDIVDNLTHLLYCEKVISRDGYKVPLYGNCDLVFHEIKDSWSI